MGIGISRMMKFMCNIVKLLWQYMFMWWSSAFWLISCCMCNTTKNCKVMYTSCSIWNLVEYISCPHCFHVLFLFTW